LGTNLQTVQRKKDFLDAFRTSGNVVKACEQTTISRQSVYMWRDKDSNFRAAFERAQIESIEHLEKEAHRRAVDGWEEPVFRESGMIGTVRKYSDTLLIFLLKGAAPEKYKDRQDIRHSGGVAIGTSSISTEEEREAFRRFALARDGT
jgi:hypothetical protein